MKKALLAGLVAMGLCGTAQAVNINPDGLGQVLFYPYYTVNGDNTTILSLVNSTDNAKAVKVRFMEGKNSREVLDFNLYLSAKDVWAAAVTLIDGTPTLVVHDTSCTTPWLYQNTYQEFLPWALDDITEVDRLREGHVEIIEMGTVVGTSAEAATHIDGVPADCPFLNDAWTPGVGGYWIDDPLEDMEAPSGGLFGGISILNVEEGTMYSADAVAIEGFATEVGDLHQVPGTILPSLNSGDVTTASVFVNGKVINSPEFERGVDAVSWALMHNQVMNEFTLNESIGSNTDWVVTFPTKSFYVDEQVTGSETALAPFTSVWDGEEACEFALINSMYDREEGSANATVPPIVSPAPPRNAGEVGLCYETTVIQFAEEGIFDSANVFVLDTEYSDGWANLDFSSVVEETPEGVDTLVARPGLGGLAGLPVIGFAAFEFVNNYVGEGDNIRANYSGLYTHKATRAEADIPEPPVSPTPTR